ncbi:cytochrome c-type biogenesis protein CcmH [Chloroflexota bacterium]
MTMNIKLKVFTLVLLIMIPVLAACSQAPIEEIEFTNITDQVICTCGCDEILSECDCVKSQEIKDTIRKGLSRGQSEEDIIQGLIDQYGEGVLAK